MRMLNLILCKNHLLTREAFCGILSFFLINCSFPCTTEASTVSTTALQPFEYNAASGTQFTLGRNGDLLELRDDSGQLLMSGAFYETNRVMITGADLENDTLTVDLSTGNPIPAGGVDYEGGAGAFDTIVITSGNSQSMSHQPISASEGNIIIDGKTIHYSGLEPVVDFAPTTSRTINGSAADDTITLSDDATANDNLSISIIPPFETYTFISPTISLTMNALAGSDTINFNGVDNLFNVSVPITINGGDPTFGDAGVPPGDTLNYNVGTGLVVPTGIGEGYILQPGQPTVYYLGIETLNGTLNFVTDFGDAPDPGYPTLLASNGARHLMGSGVYLGTCVDAELDGQPSASSDGDDSSGSLLTFGTCSVAGDDENGVTFTTALNPGNNAGINVTVSSACTLSAWIDFNADGDWTDAGEDIFPGGQALAAGVNPLSFSVPTGSSIGTTFSRFRVTTEGAVSFTGLASDGEVEDYSVAISAIPEIDVAQGSTGIASSGFYDFGLQITGISSAPVIFTIFNIGSGTLNLTGTPLIGISGPQAAEFSVNETGTSTPVAVSGTTTFTVQFSPVSTGSKSAAISIASNDSDENPYVVNLSAFGGRVPAVITDSVINTGLTTADVNCTISAVGAPEITAYGVVWNTGGSPTLSDNFTDEGPIAAPGAFTSTITGLVQGTQYFVRSYATNPSGTAYGNERQIITAVNSIPTLTEWGMIIMSLIMAGSAAWMISRRQFS